MLMKTAYRRKLAERVVSRQMTFYIARSYMASARVARRVREEMRQKNVRELLRETGRGRVIVVEWLYYVVGGRN